MVFLVGWRSLPFPETLLYHTALIAAYSLAYHLIAILDSTCTVSDVTPLSTEYYPKKKFLVLTALEPR